MESEEKKKIFRWGLPKFVLIGLVLLIGIGLIFSATALGGAETPVEESSSNQAADPVVQTSTPIENFAPNQGAINQNRDLWAYWSEELPEEFAGQNSLPASTIEFSTDFTRSAINFDEVLSGGPPKDGIPAIDNPKYLSLAEGDTFIEQPETVLVYVGTETLRVYPISILMFHEIVNDVVDGLPISVTYCPLCNTGAAFSGIGPEGEVLDFGVSGRLRFSNMLMYDRPTETWWQQATGEGVVGKYAGAQLVGVPLRIMSWAQAKDFAEGLNQSGEIETSQVLSTDTGHFRNYGRNPYVGYDLNPRPFLYQGPNTPEEFGAVDRVISYQIGDTWDALAYPVLEEEKVVNRVIEGQSISVFWFPGAVSPLETGSVSRGRNVGSAQAFYARVDGNNLDFRYDSGSFYDNQTGSEWNKFGQSISGELEGKSLEPVVSVQHFWFSWSAFERETGAQ
jgi:hypothetical protein